LQSILFSGISDFNSITDLPSKRICFSGANSYREGAVAGQEIARILGGKGKIACIFTTYSQVNHVLRMKGCLDYLAQKHPGIKSVGAFTGTGNREATLERYGEIVAKYPDIDLIFITDGHTPLVVAEDIAKKGRKIRLVAFDAIPENIDLLKAGKVACLIEQNSYAQAWNAIVNLYNSTVSSWRPVTPKLFMESFPVRLDNYRTYWDDAKNERIMKDDERAQLAMPMPNKTGKNLRFGMILPLSTGFFEGLGRGAKAANSALASYGVTVEVLDVFEDWNNFGSASVFTPVIERFVRERYDGFATVVNDPAIVQSINKAVASGLKVTTFNTEPSNFREIILSIISNISDLSRESLDLAASAEESSRANIQIGNAITAIRGDILSEQERIAESDGDLAALNGKIGKMRESIELYAAAWTTCPASPRWGRTPWTRRSVIRNGSRKSSIPSEANSRISASALPGSRNSRASSSLSPRIPTCSRSTRRSRPRVPAPRERRSPSSRGKCALFPEIPARLPRISARSLPR
jgi:ABC-type sugar transport system substrate-binding protein